MSPLKELVDQAVAAGDTAEAIGRRAHVSGETVRRVLRGENIQKAKADLILRAIVPADPQQAPTVSPLVAQEVAWAETTLVGFAHEYAARIAEALGTSMAAALRQPLHRPTSAVSTSTASARALAQLKVAADAAPARSRPAAARRARNG